VWGPARLVSTREGDVPASAGWPFSGLALRLRTYTDRLMRKHRYLARFAVAVTSCAAVCAAMLALFGAIAMAIDWELPEPQELLGPSSLFDRNGVPLYRFAADVERRVVPLDAIAPPLRDAVVAAEDHRFYEHQGVDPLSVLRAVVSNVRSGGIREGGSTLTQQLVKNVYVGADRTFFRKVREAVISVQLEKDYTKAEILEQYLNRVYFGDGAYGAEAAALSYFGKPAAELTLPEAATLASVLTSPSRLSPRADPTAAVQRRNRVLDQMAAYGLAGRPEVEAAKAAPLEVIPRELHRPAAPYYVEEIRKQLLADPGIGPEGLYNGGLVITAALDVHRQFELERQVLGLLPGDDRFDAGIAVVDPPTGDVIAAWSGRDWNVSQVDLALRQSSGRQSGSVFKVFALAAALEDGMTLQTTYSAPGQITIGAWSPRGANGCGSPCSLLEATVRSSNTVYAQVARDVGVEAFTEMAYRMGVRSTLSQDPGELAQVLGTADVTPLDLASGFATLANDGVACPARLVTEVRTPEGLPIMPPDPRRPTDEQIATWQERFTELGYDFGEEDHGRCYRALAPSVARNVTVALEQAVTRGTGTNAAIGRPQAGKTGTTNDSRMVWFVGYTPDISVAVSYGGRDAQIPLTNIPGCGRACFGGQLPASMWAAATSALLAEVPPRDFPEPVEDERVVPDRRRLGPSTPRRPEPPPRPAPEPAAEPEPEPDPVEQAPVEPTEPAEPEPPPEEGDDGGGGGGIIPILPGSGN
jgi:penicillin-binding protein 1A